MKAAKRPIHAVTKWVRRQPPNVKAFLGVVSAMTALVLLRMIVHDHDNLFVAVEAVHALGISVLIYKLTKEKTCAGPTIVNVRITGLTDLMAFTSMSLVIQQMADLYNCVICLLVAKFGSKSPFFNIAERCFSLS